MSNHFIKNIEIKNFKCFKDFKAEGFGRVNLIGGKNNVGKTAFMEACYLTTSCSVMEVYLNLHRITTVRNLINQITVGITKEEEFAYIIKDKDFEIESNIGTFYIKTLKDRYRIAYLKESEEKKFQEIENLLIVETGGRLGYALVIDFMYPLFITDLLLSMILGELKLKGKYELFSRYILKVLEIEDIDTIHNIIYIKQKGHYLKLYDFGHGVKAIIVIIASLLFVETSKKVFIDEIETGIHYTNLDKLWETILVISKEQNVQVFATTHSKECIESYARVAKKLEDEEIGFIELGRNKKDELDSVVMDSEMFQRFVKLGNEVRGW